MKDTTSRFAPLTGVGAGVLALAAFATSAPPPALSASGSTVLAFYAAHRTGQRVSDLLWMGAAVMFVFFAGRFVVQVRRTEGSDSLATTAIAAAALLAGGVTSYFGFDYLLTEVPHGVDPSVAQTINVFAQKAFLPLATGLLTFGLTAGLAIVRTGVLPRWLGWAAVVVGVAAITPVAIFAVAAMFIWTLVAAIIAVRQWSPTPSAAPVPATLRS